MTSNISRSDIQEEQLELLESESSYHSQGLHYASLSEKKRLWWRNAALNTLFIMSWCVTSACSCLLSIRHDIGLFLQPFYLCTTNGCSQPLVMHFPLPSSSLRYICLSSSLSLLSSGSHGQPISVRQSHPLVKTTGELACLSEPTRKLHGQQRLISCRTCLLTVTLPSHPTVAKAAA